jgi:hypothetical protein
MSAFLLALLILIMPGSSLETSVLMTTEHNLSIDIGPEYLLGLKGAFQSDEGSINQMILINNSSDGNATNASIFILSLPLYDEDLEKIDPTAFSDYMEIIIVSTFRLFGPEMVGETYLQDAMGKNVTLYSFTMPENILNPKGEMFSTAVWSIDPRNMILMLSYLDDDTNKQIIQTLEVES